MPTRRPAIRWSCWKYRIVHKTAYRYSEPASLSQNELILYPRQTAHQKVHERRLIIDPEPQYLHRRTDYFGNVAQVFMVQQPHEALVMSVESLVETVPTAVPEPGATPPWEEVVRRLWTPDDAETLDACQFVYESPLVAVSAGAGDYARPCFAPDTPVLAGALDLIGRIYKEFTYDKSATTVETSVDQVLADRRGVCQDFAHTAIACLRTLGLAARYVSGYLNTLPPPGKSTAGHGGIHGGAMGVERLRRPPRCGRSAFPRGRSARPLQRVDRIGTRCYDVPVKLSGGACVSATMIRSNGPNPTYRFTKTFLIASLYLI